MKATGKLLAAALIAAGMSAVSIGAGAAQGAPRGGNAGAAGGDVGALHGRHGGGYRHGYRGHGHWRGHWGFYFGAPLVWGAWGWPYYYDDFYYGPRVVYRERIASSFPEGVIEGPPVSTTEVPRGEGAPARGPLYMNYCESAKAYFPKVTSCPEGWKLATPAS